MIDRFEDIIVRLVSTEDWYTLIEPIRNSKLCRENAFVAIEFAAGNYQLERPMNVLLRSLDL